MNIWKIRSEKIGLVARIVYGLVFAAALYFGWQLWFNSMWFRFNLFEKIASTLLFIGGVNWGLVAIFGDRNMDLFKILGQ